MDKKKLIQILRTELNFLWLGGYSMRTSWGPQFFFEDSPTCINYDRCDGSKPCTECPLTEFVPPQHRDKRAACRYISLNSDGETLDSVYRYARSQDIEAMVDSWLRAAIRHLEEESTGIGNKEVR